jgi:hypothetical protein
MIPWLSSCLSVPIHSPNNFSAKPSLNSPNLQLNSKQTFPISKPKDNSFVLVLNHQSPTILQPTSIIIPIHIIFPHLSLLDFPLQLLALHHLSHLRSTSHLAYHSLQPLQSLHLIPPCLLRWCGLSKSTTLCNLFIYNPPSPF